MAKRKNEEGGTAVLERDEQEQAAKAAASEPKALAVPKVIRSHLAEKGFVYAGLKTTPNFTYTVTRKDLYGADSQLSQEEAQANLKDFETQLMAALEGMPYCFKVITTDSREAAVEGNSDSLERTYEVRIKKVAEAASDGSSEPSEPEAE